MEARGRQPVQVTHIQHRSLRGISFQTPKATTLHWLHLHTLNPLCRVRLGIALPNIDIASLLAVLAQCLSMEHSAPACPELLSTPGYQAPTLKPQAKGAAQ